MAGAGRGGPDARSAGDRDECRYIRKLATPGYAPAAVSRLRRRRAAPAGSGAGSAVPEGEPQGPSQQRRRAHRGTGSHAGEVPPPGEPGQRRRVLAVAHDRRDRSLAARLLGREQPRLTKPPPELPQAQPAQQERRQGQHARAGRGQCALRGGGAPLGRPSWRRDPNPRAFRRARRGRRWRSIPTMCSCSATISSTTRGASTRRATPTTSSRRVFDPDAEIDWTPVWSLTQQRHRYLPTSMLYSMPAEERGTADLIADSNGCAAGNTLEEAILQGFFELAERDAFAIWWYNRLRVPASRSLRLRRRVPRVGAGALRPLRAGACGCSTSPPIMGIPAYVALSRRPNADTEDIIFGAGAHADPRISGLARDLRIEPVPDLAAAARGRRRQA